MSSLKVKDWKDWEDISRYIMQYIIKTKHRVNVNYERYGSQGQKQHGVDLISMDPVAKFIVAQCKHLSGNLTWKTIACELKKTDKYPNKISEYIVLTTGKRDTSVQDALNSYGGVYIRPDKEKFTVRVMYFDEFNVWNIIPINLLQRFFPDIISQLSESALIKNSDREYIESLTTLKNFIPKVITEDDINWLETWSFSKGYVEEKHYIKFHALYIEHARTITALSNNKNLLSQGDRISITKTLPAGETFYYALNLFVKSVYDFSIAHTLENETPILWVKDLSSVMKNRIVNQWQSNAIYLAKTYRELILGEPENM
ncbi:hypothetical protein [Aeromonas veronii]|uniref:hypothetical protein n=1 Tax=Aeromonas veronii TaxID=654 RepID=UPI001FD68853|nr:hypothetical protein [Aeromonas veronii]MCJ8212211.1 hypothetical protein [Aeromonas veronii]